MTDKHLVYLGLGSNLGDREGYLREAIQKIERLIGAVVRQSAFYVSEPWGFESDNHFVNAVVACETSLSPLRLLKETQAIEREMGRTQKSVDGVYHDRVIDIDILLYGDRKVDEPGLQIPHPQLEARPFFGEMIAQVRQKLGITSI